MKTAIRICDRFVRYCTADCARKFCLYYDCKQRDCRAGICVCLTGRRQALIHESGAAAPESRVVFL